MSGNKILDGLRQAADGGFDRVTINGQRWHRERQRQPAILLTNDIPQDEVIQVLEQMVFTAARDWMRTVTIDRTVRDSIVRAFKAELR